MGPSSSIDLKVSEKILVYSQCSQLRTPAASNGNLALPEGYNYLLQKMVTSSPSDPYMPDRGGKFGSPLLFITTHWP